MNQDYPQDVQELITKIIEKDHIISMLELKIEEQRLVRLKESKEIETKAGRIKDWVSYKLRELEDQNERLREQNLKCEEQLTLLRNRLTQLSKLSHSMEDSLHGSYEDMEILSGDGITQPSNQHTAHSSTAQLTAQCSPAQLSLHNSQSSVDSESDTSPNPTPLSTPETPPPYSISKSTTSLQEYPFKVKLPRKCRTRSESPQATPREDIQLKLKLDEECQRLAKDLQAAVNELVDHDYSEIYTPNDPPELPLHRFPSWESRIYNVAENGLKLNENLIFEKDKVQCGYNFSIPVFTTVKGRASQIRSIPFSDETDSSDDEVVFDPPSNYSSIIAESSSSTSLEKCGYLIKLGGKFKTWRERWFILKNGTLIYWKSKNDAQRHAGTIIPLQNCQLIYSCNSMTFELKSDIKTWYLSSDTMKDVLEWVKILQNLLRRNVLALENDQPTLQGWVMKVNNGVTKKAWCLLVGKMFQTMKSPIDLVPTLQINMKTTRVENIEYNESEDKDIFTIGLFPFEQSPVYINFGSKQEKDTWLYNLMIVSSRPLDGTPFEQLIYKLMEIDGDANSPLWKNPILHYNKDCIAPLTSLPELLKNEAVKLIKSCQLFMSVPLDSSGIDYHIILAQNAFQHCIQYEELQSELFCLLIKQTSITQAHKFKMKHSRQFLLNATQSLFLCDNNIKLQQKHPLYKSNNIRNFILIQGMQLLSLAISLFLPSNKLLWYLKIYLKRNIDKSESGKYAAYCQRSLNRTILNGPRLFKPSRMEILSILMKNPFHHSLPHSIPVHFMNGDYHVIGFDGSTNVEEFTSTLCHEIGCREYHFSGFALYQDDPFDHNVEYYIQPLEKICDIISKWESTLREKGSGKFENQRVVTFTFKQRIYITNSDESDKEKLLQCYQINQLIVLGLFPITKELGLELCTLMAQIHHGDYKKSKFDKMQIIKKYYPKRYWDEDVGNLLIEKWNILKGKSITDCVRIYLTCTRKWDYYGASFFNVTLNEEDHIIAICEGGIGILDLNLKQIEKFNFNTIHTFGGAIDNYFMMVIEKNYEKKKLLFGGISKYKVLEMTRLIADYINNTRSRNLE